MAANTAFNLGFSLAFALGFTFGADPLFPDVQEHDGISYNPSIDPDNGGHVVIRVPGQAAQHGKLTDFFTFTRSTSGTYRGRDGLLKTATANVPRVEASGGTYTYAPHNLLIGSERYGAAGFWGDNGGTVVLNAAPAPDGRMIASVFRTTSASGQGRFQAVTLTSGRTYTLSAVFRIISGTGRIRIGCSINPANGEATFNLLTHEITSIGANAIAPTITDIGGGFKVVSISFVATSTSSTITIYNEGGGQPTPDSNSFSINSSLLQEFATVNREKYIETLGTAIAPVQTYENYRLALLIEGARTNLNLHSADQTNAVWSKGNVTIGSNAVVAPDGTTTADNLVLSGGLGVHYTYQTQAKAASALAYVYSVWLRAGTGITEAQLFMTSDITTTNGVKTIVNLATGTLSGTALIGVGWANAAATIENWGNGWYRVTLSGTSDAIATITTFQYASIAGATNINSDGSFLTVWGSQLEQNTFPFATTYVGTTGTTGPRAADAAVRIAGAEVSSAAGTIILNLSVLGSSSIGGSFAELNNTTSNESVWISDNGGGNLDLRVRNAGADVAGISTGAVLPPDTRTRFGIVYSTNDFIFCEDGVLSGADLSGATPVGLNRVVFGLSLGFGGTAYERIYGFDYWPERLPNAVFQQLAAKP